VKRRLLLAGACAAWATVGLGSGLARAGADRGSSEIAPPSGMKARVFQLKHQDPGSVVEAIHPLCSGMPGFLVRANDELRTVSVRDFPENLATIEQTIKRLDVPSPPKPDIEVRIHVLIGSASAGGGQVPPELEGVVAQLRATLSYKSYFQIAAVTQRVRAGAGAKGKGQLVLSPPAVDQAGNGHFHYSLDNVSMAVSGSSAPPQVTLRRFNFELDGGSLGEAEVTTGLTLRDGEKVVVGTGSLKNRAMIIVLSARQVKG
jgi:Bacterial type II/III secretion system short domain